MILIFTGSGTWNHHWTWWYILLSLLLSCVTKGTSKCRIDSWLVYSVGRNINRVQARVTGKTADYSRECWTHKVILCKGAQECIAYCVLTHDIPTAWEPQPLGALGAYTGLYRDSFTFVSDVVTDELKACDLVGLCHTVGRRLIFDTVDDETSSDCNDQPFPSTTHNRRAKIFSTLWQL